MFRFVSFVLPVTELFNLLPAVDVPIDVDDGYRPHLPLGYGGESLIGIRDTNEDCEVINESLGVFGSYFAVFDGHAGKRFEISLQNTTQ